MSHGATYLITEERSDGHVTGDMDTAVIEHLGYEAADDVDGVMATLSDDPEHEVIPSPVGKLTDRAKIRAYYEMIFGDLRGGSVTPVRRLYGDDSLVDETTWHGRFDDGRSVLLDGTSGDVSFRMLHIFRFRNGKICSEQVWTDLAAIQAQLV
jgi:ketosteroid isomerase-like protein